MKMELFKRILKKQYINDNVKHSPKEFVAQEDQRYKDNVIMVAEYLKESIHENRLVFLSGPSSAGKTTTARTLCSELSSRGIEAHVVSMDDFYRGAGQAPVLEDGKYDYEALEALRLDVLVECMDDIIKSGETLLPIYDFNSGKPADEKKPLKVSENSVVIFEGIHAINPYFEKYVPVDHMFKLFVNTITPFLNNGKKIIRRRDIRLIRRSLRDTQFRNSPVEMTMDMWPQVARGENKYMFPYVDTVDFIIDTTHAYEPCLISSRLTPLLEKVDKGSLHYENATRLIEILSGFDHLDESYVPGDSLLREFIGGGIHQ